MQIKHKPIDRYFVEQYVGNVPIFYYNLHFIWYLAFDILYMAV